ncbi:MAG: RsmB/NOP family class I SAM-dependent RNA methyltransferase [Thermoanaerobaculum sp.]|nr:RsmB/NOP family class I SAM-dependent RNA methyltransferase [Thermoanaerobaculum sp.]
MNSSVDARREAARVLARVDAQQAHAARLLDGAPPLTRELVMLVLRWQLTLDHVLQAVTHRPLSLVHPAVRACLRMGLAEARFLRTPPAVAVAEAVRVCKVLLPKAAGLVNASLRRAVQQPWPSPEDEGTPLWLRYSHPPWLVERWQRRLPENLLLQALASAQQPAPLCLLAGVSQLPAGVGASPHPFVPGVLVVTEGGSQAAQACAGGKAYAMDPTAVAVARLLPRGQRLLELAAAPGGKSLVVGLEQADSLRVALDLRVGRVRLLARAVRLLTSPPRVLVGDARRPPLRRHSFHAVLLDAPCSGTGTLRRHPEIRWRLTSRHIAELAQLQQELLASAVNLTAPGGHVLYATCSLEPEENEEVVQRLGLPVTPMTHGLPPNLPRLELSSGGVLIPPGPWGDGFVVHLLGPLP